MFKVIGIDEAGRGPVIGSLFIGFAIISLEEESKIEEYFKYLKNMGVKDSKVLTPKKRAQLYEELSKHMDAKYLQLTPQVIDANLFTGTTLNELQLRGIIQMLELEKPQKIYIDALTADPDKYKKEILSRLSFKCDIVAENKADAKYEIVGAASIVAKELREKEVGEIKDNIKLDIGSGYPADPKTKEFLSKHWNNKEFDFIFRKSWDTYKKIAEKNNQKSVLDY